MTILSSLIILPIMYVVYMCQKSLNFTYAFKCYHQKCKLASLYMAHPVYDDTER